MSSGMISTPGMPTTLWRLLPLRFLVASSVIAFQNGLASVSWIAEHGDDVDDRHADGAQAYEQRAGARDHAGAALGRQRQRGDSGIEMPAMHVDGEERRAARVEVHCGSFNGVALPRTLEDGTMERAAAC